MGVSAKPLRWSETVENIKIIPSTCGNRFSVCVKQVNRDDTVKVASVWISREQMYELVDEILNELNVDKSTN